MRKWKRVETADGPRFRSALAAHEAALLQSLATSLVGISFFGWLTEQVNEHTSVIGIGVVLFGLGVAAALFSRRIQTRGDSSDDDIEPDPATVASGFA